MVACSIKILVDQGFGFPLLEIREEGTRVTKELALAILAPFSLRGITLVLYVKPLVLLIRDINCVVRCMPSSRLYLHKSKKLKL